MSEAQKLRALERRERCQRLGAGLVRELRAGECGDEKLSEMRSAIIEQDCPFCGESGFKSIAGHVQIIHGIASEELRELAVFTRSESICSRELAARLSEIHEGNDPHKLGKHIGMRKVSEKGRASMRRNGLKGLASIPKDRRIEAGRRVGKSNAGRGETKAPHGKYARYKYGCRCGLCVQGQRQYWRDYRRAHAQSDRSADGA